jgi:uncharacterized protein (AIM24 family)
MMFLEDGIKFEAKFGDGSEPKQSFWKKLLAAGGRLLTGESLFVTHFTNESQRKARVAFAAPYPGNIVPLNLANLGGSITCQRDAFLCAALGTKISLAFNKRIGSGLFGGEGVCFRILSLIQSAETFLMVFLLSFDSKDLFCKKCRAMAWHLCTLVAPLSEENLTTSAFD